MLAWSCGTVNLSTLFAEQISVHGFASPQHRQGHPLRGHLDETAHGAASGRSCGALRSPMHLDFRTANAAGGGWKMDGKDEFFELGSSPTVGRNPLRLRWRATRGKVTGAGFWRW